MRHKISWNCQISAPYRKILLYNLQLAPKVSIDVLYEVNMLFIAS